MKHSSSKNDKLSKKGDQHTYDNLTEGQKWIICFMSGLLFLLISSPFMYRLTNQVTSMVGFETSVNGCPNLYGLLLHGVVFLLLVRALMLIPASQNASSESPQF